jgi:acyl carrier protein
MPTDVTDRIKLIVKRMDVPIPADFSEATPLFNQGVGMDSFAAVELITLIEKDFAIEFDVADIRPEHFADVGTLGRLVERYLSAS